MDKGQMFSGNFYVGFSSSFLGVVSPYKYKNNSKRPKVKRGACMFSLRARTRETWIKIHIGLSLYRLGETK